MQARLTHGRRPPDGPAGTCHTGAKRTQQTLSRSRAPVFQAPCVTAKSLLHIRTQTHRLLSLATSRSSPDLLGAGSRAWKGDRKDTAATTAPGLTSGPVPVLPRPWSLRMAEGPRTLGAGRPSNPATPSSAAVIHSANTAEQPPAPFARSPSMKAGGSPAFSEVTGREGAAHKQEAQPGASGLRSPGAGGLRSPAPPLKGAGQASLQAVPGAERTRGTHWSAEAVRPGRCSEQPLRTWQSAERPVALGCPRPQSANCRPVPGK